MTIEEVKQFLRIDEDEDDAMIELMMAAAESYIKDSVGSYDPENPKAKLLFLLIMQDFYENRVLAVKEIDKQRLSHITGSIVMQLQAGELDKEWTLES